MPRAPAPLSVEPRTLVHAAGFILGAVLVRSPAMLYSVLNYDESLYLLMGAELARGHLPYTTVCDLKPFGLFALAAPIAASPLDPVFTARIMSSVTVGLTAWLLSRVACRLFGAGNWAIGIAAGLAYVLFSLVDGGMSFQGELFQNAASVLGLVLVLGAVGHRPPRLACMAAAGLVLGIGLQIKQSVLFDILAFLSGFFILTAPTWRGGAAHLRANLLPLLALGAASLVPTLLVILLYAAAGELDAWWAANVEAHRVFYGSNRGFVWGAAFHAVWEQLPLWAGGLTALLFYSSLAIERREQRSVAFLGIWFAAVIASVVFLRISSDHYFLQFLPPLSLLAGVLIARGLLPFVPEQQVAARILLTLATLTLFAVAKRPLIHSILIVRDRLAGETWAGDTPRHIAADLKPVLREGDAVYVVGFQPVVYVLTGAAIPTRFAFTGLPHSQVPGRDGCPWIDPATELRRILQGQPRFIIVERGIFVEEMRPDVLRILNEHLARDYRLRRRFDRHPIHYAYPFEPFVMNGSSPADVYERKEG
jgi:hypothetical protein